jgi:hypothetical protein
MEVRDTAEILVAGGTLILAIATVYLGAETRRLAKETLRGIRQADYQHQEALTPIVKVVGTDIVPSAEYADNEDRSFPVTIANRGTGPALSVVLSYKLGRIQGDADEAPRQGNKPPAEQSWSLEPLGAGEERLENVPLAAPHGFRPAISSWQVTLTYENLFGAPGKTIYTATTGRKVFYQRPPVLIRDRDK